MEKEEKKISCFDTSYWYQNDCKDLEKRSEIKDYQCQKFNVDNFFSKSHLRNLPQHKFEKLAKEYKLEGNRQIVEGQIYYSTLINALDKYIFETNNYAIKLSNCAKARQNHYDNCKNNTEGQVEDEGHRFARLKMNEYYPICQTFLSHAITLLGKLKREYETWKNQNQIIEKVSQAIDVDKGKEEQGFTITERIFSSNDNLGDDQSYSSDDVIFESFDENDKLDEETIDRKIKYMENQRLKELEDFEARQVYIHKEQKIDQLQTQEVIKLNFVNPLKSILSKTMNGVEEKHKPIFDKLVSSFNVEPFYLPLVDISLDQLNEICHILVNYTTEENAMYWESFFYPFYIFEDDTRVGKKSKTGYPYFSSNRTQLFFTCLMSEYLKNVNTSSKLGHNTAVFSRISALLNRDMFVDYISTLQKHKYVRNIAAVLDQYLVNRVGLTVNYMIDFMETYGFNKFTCDETIDTIRRLQDFIRGQNVSKAPNVSISKDKKLILKIDWPRENPALTTMDQFIKDYKTGCREYFQWNETTNKKKK